MLSRLLLHRPLPFLGCTVHASLAAMGCGASAGSNYKVSPVETLQTAPTIEPAAHTSPQTATESAAVSEPAAPTSEDAAETSTQVTRPTGRWRTAIVADLRVDEFQDEPAVTDGSKKAVARAGEALSQAFQSRRLEEVLEKHQFEAEPPTKGEGEAETEEPL